MPYGAVSDLKSYSIYINFYSHCKTKFVYT